MRDLAVRLMAWEAKASRSSGTRPKEVFLVCEKLRPHLSGLMGKTGYRALLSRALVMARQKASLPGTMRVTAEGTLDGLDEPEMRVDANKLAVGSAILIALLLELLAAFIGENMTLQIVREVWPKVTLDDSDFGEGATK